MNRKGIFETYFEDMKQQVIAALRVPPWYLGLGQVQLLLPEHCVGDCPVCGEDKEIIGSYGEELWPCCYCVTKECLIGHDQFYGLDSQVKFSAVVLRRD